MKAWIAFLPFLAAGATASAQWLNHPDSTTPRTRDGKANLSAPVPRANGKVDLSGLWQAARTPQAEYEAVLGADMAAVEIDLYDVTKHAVNALWGLKPEEEPLLPEAVARMNQRMQDTPRLCLPNSVPMASQITAFKIVQTPRELVILHESGDPHRQVYLDGRKFPADPDPTWMGYSVGTWQGQTLVVETVGITDRAPLDFVGHPRSGTMRITERYRRVDFGHMDLEITMEDPVYYSRPIRYTSKLTLIPDSDVLEYICNENEKSAAHITAAP